MTLSPIGYLCHIAAAMLRNDSLFQKEMFKLGAPIGPPQNLVVSINNIFGISVSCFSMLLILMFMPF